MLEEKQKPQTRTKFKKIRVTSEEAKTIETKAAQSSLIVSEYIRKASLGTPIKTPRSQKSDQTLYHLAKIGASLNQISIQARLNGYSPKPIDNISTELISLLKKIK